MGELAPTEAHNEMETARMRAKPPAMPLPYPAWPFGSRRRIDPCVLHVSLALSSRPGTAHCLEAVISLSTRRVESTEEASCASLGVHRARISSLTLSH